MEPAREVGGDLYDCFMQRLTGSVSWSVMCRAKGAPAAMFMARTRSRMTVEPLIAWNAELSPTEITETVNLSFARITMIACL